MQHSKLLKGIIFKKQLHMKKTIINFTLVLLVGILILSCEDNTSGFLETDLSKEHLIPKPVAVISTKSSFILDKNTTINTDSDSKFIAVGKFLLKKIKSKTGLNLKTTTNNSTTKGIFILKVDDGTLGDEGYKITISENSITINAKSDKGAFNAIQTLRQLIPFKSFSEQEKKYTIPTGTIKDLPNFEYRGAMLDVARHFFSVDDVKKYIDAMAYYKMNILHLHLSDDQGWRIEIKSWPELTEIGGHTSVGGESGGFYTQEDYTEIVNYAAENYITIIPEIDMPGHTHAAYTSYPILDGRKTSTSILENNISDKKALLYTGTEVGFSTFDTRKEEVYTFIDDVIREISELTPGKYFHMGGDESLVTEHNDYVYFVERVGGIIRKYDKTMIGWDEVAKANLDSTSVVQFWAKEDNALKASENGMKIILSPAKKIYLDQKYDSVSKYGLHWAAYISVDSAYIWSPEKYIKGINKEQILGVEAPLWSETINTREELEYLAFPRLIGAAELGWSIEENRNWEDYKLRLANQTQYLNMMDIKYYPSKLIDWK